MLSQMMTLKKGFEHYQDSGNANSPTEDSGEDNDDRIVKGYHLKITQSDKVRLQCQCLGKGCKWSMWASKCKNELSFQLSRQENPHTCISFTFE